MMRPTLLRLTILIGLASAALGAILASQAKADPLPPPHLGYGVNVRRNVDMADGLGFDWIKLYEADYLYPSPKDFPPEADKYNVLYRVKAEGWPASIENYIEHVKQLVADGKARHVRAYEIGNEPNIKPMWGDQKVSPQKYARLLCRVYPAIKAIDPNAIVVSAGVAPVGRQPELWWDSVMDDQVFVQRMFDTMRLEFPNQWPCFDAFGYHPQGYPYPPEISYPELEQQHPDDNGNGFHFRSSEYYHALMDGYGIGNHQIWATEFGYLRNPSEDPWDGPPPYMDYGWCNRWGEGFRDFTWMEVSEAQQADYLVRAYQYADANMPWMGVIFLYNVDWNNQGWECDHVKFFSIYKVATGSSDTDPWSHRKAQAFTALANMPKRSAYRTTPSLSMQPASVTFLAELTSPGVQTQTIQINNAQPGTVMTWTAQIDPAAVLQPVITPISGTNPGALTVQIDTTPFATTSAYTGTIVVSAQPASTIPNSATIGVNLILVDQLMRVYLPQISMNYTAPPPTSTLTTKYGLAFVSSAETPADSVRYQHAITLNAAINRWPMYWYAIEKNPLTQPRVFDWSKQDANAIADIDHGLAIDAILMLTPPDLATAGSPNAAMPQIGDGLRLQTGGISIQGVNAVSSVASPPQGLYDPVFGDNSDTPGAGKSINPTNRWAVFVDAAVSRYKPGGTLAQAQGWTAGKGIRYWEIWNEEDLQFFFSGTPADYARLLKVAYLAAKHADAQATILFGGMAHFEKPDWLNNVLNAISTYPDKAANNWFMDAVASHNYSWAWQTFGYLYQDRTRLDARGLANVRLWLTETGVPVWNDPIYYINDPTSAYHATMSEQADFLIQTMAFADWMSAEAAIWFQLYDDTGNGCANRDAFGLVRNPASGPCYVGDGTTRPAYDAYKVATQYLSGLSPYRRDRPTPNQELITFRNTSTGDRVVAMWARDYLTETVTLTATDSSALLVYPNGTTQAIAPVDGVYTIDLPAATNDNTPTTDGKAPIGGSPRLLIEHDPAIVVKP